MRGSRLVSRERRALACALLVGAGLALRPAPARASFHFAHISEVMTSYGGDDDVQFVEITMDAAGQQFVLGTKLNAFDASGTFVGTVLTVPGDVASGVNRPWIMGTTAFEAASGIQVDFEFAPGVIPTGGGMVCWGKPGNDTTTVSCPTSGFTYVDCLAYGNYTGSTNNCIGTPHPLSPDGRSLRRTSLGKNNALNFVCSDPAEPENNALASASMPATSPCPVCGNDTTEPPGEQCDGIDDAACPGLCLGNCLCPICGDGDVNAPSEVCDGADDAACPGDCLTDCTCATCGDNVTEPPAEECDGTDDADCPGTCVAPGDPDECQCPGSLDHFLCYKGAAKREATVTLTDSFDNGSYGLKGLKRLCTPTDKENEGVFDQLSHLTVYKIKGAHAAQVGIGVSNQLGEFTIDTKKAHALAVPAAKSIVPAPPPGPLASTLVDHYRCLKAKYAKTSFKVPKGLHLATNDQFGPNSLEVKKPVTLCIATDKNGEGVHRPNDHLLCFKVKPSTKHATPGAQTNDQLGALAYDLKGEIEFCLPSRLSP